MSEHPELSAQELESGEWVDELTALSLTNSGLPALRQRRRRGTVLAKPRRVTKSGGRDWWYLRADLERLTTPRLVASIRTDAGDDRRMQELETALAKAEARTFEIEALRTELRAQAALAEQRQATLEAENRRLRQLLSHLNQAIATQIEERS